MPSDRRELLLSDRRSRKLAITRHCTDFAGDLLPPVAVLLTAVQSELDPLRTLTETNARISSSTTRQSSPRSRAASSERRSISAAQARCTSSSDASRLASSSAASTARSSGSSSSACCRTRLVASVTWRFYSLIRTVTSSPEGWDISFITISLSVITTTVDERVP